MARHAHSPCGNPRRVIVASLGDLDTAAMLVNMRIRARRELSLAFVAMGRDDLPSD